MTGPGPGGAEVAAALRRVATPVGLPGSGRLRYGAAMTLHAGGLIGFEVLEVYRILAMTDAEDPARLLAARRLRPPPAPAVDPAAALDDLAGAVDAALAACRAGPVTRLRQALAAARLAAPPRPRPAPLAPEAAGWLAEALERAMEGALRGAADAALAAALRQAAPALGWTTAERAARAPLLGPGAPLDSAAAALDILLLPPGAALPAPAASEVWLPLSAPEAGPASPRLAIRGRMVPGDAR